MKKQDPKLGRPTKHFLSPLDRFGAWTIICKEVIPGYYKRKNVSMWVCECDCGTVALKNTTSLTSGRELRCMACYTKEKQTNQETGIWDEYGFRVLYLVDRSGAKAKKVTFDLTFEEWKDIVIEPCFYCGASGSRKTRSSGKFATVNGIDRYYNECGYNVINSVPCCGLHNIEKKARDGDDYIKDNLRKVAWIS